MNEMRKLMEAIKLIEDFDDEEHYSIKHAEIEKFQGRKIIITDLYDGDIYGILDNKHGPRFMISAPIWRDGIGPGEVMDDEVSIVSPTFDITKRDKEFLKQWYMESVNEGIGEAYQGGKTEHSGAKKGQGAYYGRKKDAKKDSNKNRRLYGKAEVKDVDEAYDEEVSGETRFRDANEMLRNMLSDLQTLERNTSRVYREAQQSQHREDFTTMLLNELNETLNDITNLVEKYEDAFVSTPGL